MSRITKKEFKIEPGVEFSLNEGVLKLTGPKGELSLKIPASLKFSREGDTAVLDKELERENIFGLYGALLANLFHGVQTGFRKELELVGVGFKVKKEGRDLSLNLGFSHPVKFIVPAGIEVEVKDDTHLVVVGASRQAVGQIGALIRDLKKPEPYKGKGIKYAGEVIRRKAGKAAKAGVVAK